MDNGKRPGVSEAFLAHHDIHHVDEFQAESLVGIKAPGIIIPYPDLAALQLLVNDKPFCRLRLDKPFNGAKYLQRKDTGSQLFIPQGAPFGKELVIVEGEFKSLSLSEQGIPAVAIGGISSAMKDGELIPGLARLFKKYPLQTVFFLGDSDTALNFEFSREACKLGKRLPEGCTLKLPRIPLNAPGKGIDDVKGALGDAFMEFWQKTTSQAVEVTSKTNPSALCVELLLLEFEAIKNSPPTRLRDYKSQIVALGGRLDDVALAELAQAAKNHFGIPISAFKQTAARRNLEDACEHALPNFCYDGSSYFRPYQDGFESMTCSATERALRRLGFRHRTANGCELTPTEIALARIEEENRVDYAGPFCGRPAGFWQEGKTRILCTRGPTIIEAKEGDVSAMERFLLSLFGNGRDPFFREQFLTYCGWLLHARHALRNPRQHLPGQALGLVGPRDCGKSLLQSQITLKIGGREADPSLWLVKGNDFNGSLWRAEHLRLGDEELIEDSRDRHALRDRVKKMVTADLFPLHRKHQEAIDLRPIWRVTISCNDDGGSLAVLPPLSEDFFDKVIYLRCHPPLEPYHDGTEKGRRDFWDRLEGAIPAFLHKIETLPLPHEFRKSRFYVREFHHPEIIELIAGASPVAAFAELLINWLNHLGGNTQGAAVELFENLKQWYKEAYDEKNLGNYISGPVHFSHQLRKVSELPAWKGCIIKGEPRYTGPSRNAQTVWKITLRGVA